jgi:protein TonB
MDLRRVTAAAGAVGINALVASAMVALSGNGPPSRPVRIEPVIARLVESPPPEAPKPVAVPPPPRAEPVRERRVERPAAREVGANPAPPQAGAKPLDRERSAPQAKSESAPAPMREVPASDMRPAPAAPSTALAAAAPAPSANSAPAMSVQTAPSAPAQAATAAASPAASGPTASVPPSSDAARRVGPRVDASWAGNTPPSYPAAARRMSEQGEVRLDVHVGADGSVIDVQVRASSGSPALDRSAMDAVRRWRFRPATVDGQAVSEWYRDWKWVFRLEG